MAEATVPAGTAGAVVADVVMVVDVLIAVPLSWWATRGGPVRCEPSQLATPLSQTIDNDSQAPTGAGQSDPALTCESDGTAAAGSVGRL
ncbi:hypothetical protein [Actinocatenispora rupis]|uniref:hypothetical protein n=1 Tax=Actinocatenispora rupis TaxID=519421 RepID=UPI001940FECE|nr:hypothetical protein [Actinocatenispora rupis]